MDNSDRNEQPASGGVVGGGVVGGGVVGGGVVDGGSGVVDGGTDRFHFLYSFGFR